MSKLSLIDKIVWHRLPGFESDWTTREEVEAALAAAAEIPVSDEMVQAALDAYPWCAPYNTDAVNMRAAIEAALAQKTAPNRA